MIGDVYMMLFEGDDSEQSGWRPGLVFQNNKGNKFSPNIIALPMTSVIKKTTQPTHVVISRKDTGLRTDSMVLCENPERMSKAKVGKYLTTIPGKDMKRVAEASLLSSSVISFLDQETLLNTWRKATELNCGLAA